MIAHLKGTLASKAGDRIVVDVGGVGYAVAVPGSTASRLPSPGEEVLLHTHLAVRQDSLVLYGFSTQDEMLMFLRLTSVSGIGPKNALAVLSQYSPPVFYSYVLNEDVDALVQVPGVGQKTAQRIILELRDRIGVGRKKGGRQKAGVQRTPSTVTEEAVYALMALGYVRAEAEAAVNEATGAGQAGATGATVEEIITRALRSMAKV